MADTLTIVDEGAIIEIVQGGELTVVHAVQSGVEIEQLRFIQLADTPDSYENAAGKTVTVNEDGDGLQFSKTYNTFLSLDDTPSRYEGVNQLVAVNQAGNALRFINYTVEDVNIEYFTQLADVPQSYKDQANKILVVSKEEDGVDFAEFNTVMPDQSNLTPGSYTYPKIVVNQKGIITAIEEGKPFEFDEFLDDQILVGDGTNSPAQLPKGNVNQYLMTGTGLAPVWNYVDKLIYNGHSVVAGSEVSTTDTGTLIVQAGSTAISLTGNANQGLVLGDVNSNQTITFNGNLVIPSNRSINALGGLRIDPNNGTVGITGIASEVYNARLGDNDFITKSWYETEQSKIVVNATYERTPIEEITSETVQLSIPNNSTLMEVYLQVTSDFNPEAGLQITDSYNQVLYDSSESPILDYQNLRVSFNIPVQDTDFKITCSVIGYQYGQGQIFASYFTAGN